MAGLQPVVAEQCTEQRGFGEKHWAAAWDFGAEAECARLQGALWMFAAADGGIGADSRRVPCVEQLVSPYGRELGFPETSPVQVAIFQKLY